MPKNTLPCTDRYTIYQRKGSSTHKMKSKGQVKKLSKQRLNPDMESVKTLTGFQKVADEIEKECEGPHQAIALPAPKIIQIPREIVMFNEDVDSMVDSSERT